jgi:hypothetical protein
MPRSAEAWNYFKINGLNHRSEKHNPARLRQYAVILMENIASCGGVPDVGQQEIENCPMALRAMDDVQII